jgi:hypothetical protein
MKKKNPVVFKKGQNQNQLCPMEKSLPNKTVGHKEVSIISYFHSWLLIDRGMHPSSPKIAQINKSLFIISGGLYHQQPSLLPILVYSI